MDVIKGWTLVYKFVAEGAKFPATIYFGVLDGVILLSPPFLPSMPSFMSSMRRRDDEEMWDRMEGGRDK